jgi:chloramphenicol-sensitive protein RarD
MATIGFLQYITPTMHFLIAVVLYREPFTAAGLVSFGFIWLGLVVYSLDAWLVIRRLGQ